MSGRQGARRRKHELSTIRNDGCPTPVKIGYVSRSAAKRALVKVRTNGHVGRPGSTLHVYLCECGAFHLGNLPSDQRRDKAPVATDERACAKRFDGGVTCAFPAVHQLEIGGGLVGLCDLHHGELLAVVAERRAAA